MPTPLAGGQENSFAPQMIFLWPPARGVGKLFHKIPVFFKRLLLVVAATPGPGKISAWWCKRCKGSAKILIEDQFLKQNTGELQTYCKPVKLLCNHNFDLSNWPWSVVRVRVTTSWKAAAAHCIIAIVSICHMMAMLWVMTLFVLLRLPQLSPLKHGSLKMTMCTLMQNYLFSRDFSCDTFAAVASCTTQSQTFTGQVISESDLHLTLIYMYFPHILGI